MMTVYLDGKLVKGLIDMDVNITILTETEALPFLYWKFLPGPYISGVGGQQNSENTAQSDYWKDLDSNQVSFSPIVPKASCNLWGRAILEDMSVALTTDHRAFFDIMIHNKLGFSGFTTPTDHPEAHPQF